MGRRYQHPRAKRRQRDSKFSVSDCFIEPPQVPRRPPCAGATQYTAPTRVDQRAPAAARFRAPRCCLHTPAHRMPYSHHHAAPAVRCKSYLLSVEEAPQRKKKCHVIIIIITRRSIVISAPPLLGRFIIIVRRPLVLSAPHWGASYFTLKLTADFWLGKLVFVLCFFDL